MSEYSGKEDDVSMLNDDQLARAEALRMARAVLEVRGVGGSFLTPGSIQPGKAYDITSMANWIISGQFGLVAVGPTPVMDYSDSRPPETVVERTEPDDPEPDAEQCPECDHLPHLPSACEPGCFCHRTHSEVKFEIPEGERERMAAPKATASPGAPSWVQDIADEMNEQLRLHSEVKFEIPEGERERQAASGRSARINVEGISFDPESDDDVKRAEQDYWSRNVPKIEWGPEVTIGRPPADVEDGWPVRTEAAELARSHDEDELP